VALILPYENVEDAIDIANGTRYGLGASVFGPNQEECIEVAKRLECGMVSVNDFAVFYVRDCVCYSMASFLILPAADEVGLSNNGQCHQLTICLNFSQDLPFGGTKASGYGRFGIYSSSPHVYSQTLNHSPLRFQLAQRVSAHSPILKPSS
jgi:acyl-CoA reductase-like NAD-dependent aldehyde dehydrogenase